MYSAKENSRTIDANKLETTLPPSRLWPKQTKTRAKANFFANLTFFTLLLDCLIDHEQTYHHNVRAYSVNSFRSETLRWSGLDDSQHGGERECEQYPCVGRHVAPCTSLWSIGVVEGDDHRKMKSCTSIFGYLLLEFHSPLRRSTLNRMRKPTAGIQACFQKSRLNLRDHYCSKCPS